MHGDQDRHRQRAHSLHTVENDQTDSRRPAPAHPASRVSRTPHSHRQHRHPIPTHTPTPQTNPSPPPRSRPAHRPPATDPHGSSQTPHRHDARTDSPLPLRPIPADTDTSTTPHPTHPAGPATDPAQPAPDKPDTRHGGGVLPTSVGRTPRSRRRSGGTAQTDVCPTNPARSAASPVDQSPATRAGRSFAKPCRKTSRQACGS